jgi:hypothetical protein
MKFIVTVPVLSAVGSRISRMEHLFSRQGRWSPIRVFLRFSSSVRIGGAGAATLQLDVASAKGHRASFMDA